MYGFLSKFSGSGHGFLLLPGKCMAGSGAFQDTLRTAFREAMLGSGGVRLRRWEAKRIGTENVNKC